MQLRPTLDFKDANMSKEEEMKQRLNAFVDPFIKYRDIIEKNKPFYSEKVYNSLETIMEQCYGEKIDYEYIERPSREYFKEARENRKQIIDSIEKACLEIRNRIEDVKVV